jgi:hypothetical protein
LLYHAGNRREDAEVLHLLPTSSCVWLLIIDGSLALLLHYTGHKRVESEKNVEDTSTAEDGMQQNSLTLMRDTEDATFVTLLTVQREVGIARGTLKKYSTYLGIEPICFHIGTRSLSISQETMTLMKCLKQNPALLAQLPSPVLPPGSSEKEATGYDKRKDSSDGR